MWPLFRPRPKRGSAKYNIYVHISRLHRKRVSVKMKPSTHRHTQTDTHTQRERERLMSGVYRSGWEGDISGGNTTVMQ